MKFIRHGALALCIAMLAGCGSTLPVKDVLADPQAHLAANFSESKLSESVRSALDIKAPGIVKRRLRIDAVMTNFEGDKQLSFDKQNTYQVLDNGLVRVLVQTGNNGILALSEFEVTYHSIFALIYQSVSHGVTTSSPLTYAKAVASVDKGIANPQEGAEYVFEYALAPEIQIMNFRYQKAVCKTGKWAAANALHAKFSGLALPVDCEYFGTNGQTFLKTQSSFIKDLGITLRRESASSTRRRTWKITDVML